MKRILIAIAASTLLAAPAMADMALAKSKNCMACHAMDKKLVGPSYQAVAQKYAGDKAAAAKLATKIMKGGAGVWGAIPMPFPCQPTHRYLRMRPRSWLLGS